MRDTITETIGLDLGDRRSSYCVIEQSTGGLRETGDMPTSPAALAQFLTGRSAARVVMEVGTHSPWASRVARDHCPQVLVANARSLSFIFKNPRKSDRVDAAALARVGRMDPELLSPIEHRGASAQRDLTTIRARSGLVAARTKLVTSLRGLIKAYGARLPKKDAGTIDLRMLDQVPADLADALRPMLAAIQGLTAQIKIYDRQIDKLAEAYPDTRVLTQVTGVGNLTALAFVLTLESPHRIRRNRDVGALLGLVPRRDQSGQTDKQLRITKAGDHLLRTLLVQASHYILGRHGPRCALRSFGERLAARGGPIAKRKAVIAVARKLAVLLIALWRTGEVYDPLRGLPASA